MGWAGSRSDHDERLQNVYLRPVRSLVLDVDWRGQVKGHPRCQRLFL